MKLSEIMDLVEEVLPIDEGNLAKESLNIAKVYGRFLRIRTEENLRLSVLKNELKQLFFDKREYYSGKADPEVYREKPFNKRLLKTEVDQYVEVDEDIQNMLAKIEVQSEKVTYLNDALKMISNRQFHIRAAIDHNKLVNGGY